MKINIEINDNLKYINWFIREKYNNIINLIDYIFNILRKITKELENNKNNILNDYKKYYTKSKINKVKMNYMLNIIFKNYINKYNNDIFKNINWDKFYDCSNIKYYEEYLNHIDKLNKNNILFCLYKLYSKYNKTLVVLKSLTKYINKSNNLIK